MLSPSGYTFSHSNLADNDKRQNNWRIEEGDLITVEADPYTGKLTFSKAGQKPFVLATDISKKTTDEVYFCALLGHQDSEISIL